MPNGAIAHAGVLVLDDCAGQALTRLLGWHREPPDPAAWEYTKYRKSYFKSLLCCVRAGAVAKAGLIFTS